MHTPGPLTVRQAKGPVDGEFDCAIVAVIDGQPQVIGEAFGRSSETARPPARANATLWAAAPELLEALESIMESFPGEESKCLYDHRGICQEHFLQPRGECGVALARAAIAKARGEA